MKCFTGVLATCLLRWAWIITDISNHLFWPLPNIVRYFGDSTINIVCQMEVATPDVACAHMHDEYRYLYECIYLMAKTALVNKLNQSNSISI